MQIILNTPLDWFDELAVKVIDTLLRWQVGGASTFTAPSRGPWVFDFDEYRNDGRAAAVKELLVTFSEKSKQATIHTLNTLAGFLIMSSERYDFSMLRATRPDPAIKVRHMAAILRREFGA
jgi:hypothetical protein